MNRRSFVAAIAGTGVSAALAGCTSLLSQSPPDGLDAVEEDADQLPRPTLGSGPVTIDVYEDFACPACHQFGAHVFPELEESLIEPGEVTYRHFEYVLPVDDRSVHMANAARAVQDDTRTDGDPNGEFFEYKRAVFRADDWSDETLVALAEEVGADGAAIASALEEETYFPTVAADWYHGDDRGVSGTPTVFVEDEQIGGETVGELLEEIHAAVDAQ